MNKSPLVGWGIGARHAARMHQKKRIGAHKRAREALHGALFDQTSDLTMEAVILLLLPFQMGPQL